MEKNFKNVQNYYETKNITIKNYSTKKHTQGKIRYGHQKKNTEIAN